MKKVLCTVLTAALLMCSLAVCSLADADHFYTDLSDEALYALIDREIAEATDHTIFLTFAQIQKEDEGAAVLAGLGLPCDFSDATVFPHIGYRTGDFLVVRMVLPEEQLRDAMFRLMRCEEILSCALNGAHVKYPTDDPAAEAVRGDANLDGKLSAEDYVLTKRAALGSLGLSKDAMRRVDLNGNGRVDAMEYANIKRAVLGTLKLGTFPLD